MCCSVIADLPDTESPELYGLHERQTVELSLSESQQLQRLLHAVEFPAEVYGLV